MLLASLDKRGGSHQHYKSWMLPWVLLLGFWTWNSWGLVRYEEAEQIRETRVSSAPLNLRPQEFVFSMFCAFSFPLYSPPQLPSGEKNSSQAESTPLKRRT